MLTVIVSNLQGQWYTNKYNVSDISFLSQEELAEARIETRSNAIISGVVAGIGGSVYLIFRYLKPGMSEDPGILEQLIGDEGMNIVGQALGIGIAAGGTIAGVVYIGRLIRIQSVMNEYYPSYTSLRIGPALISNSYSKSFNPGFTLIYNF